MLYMYEYDCALRVQYIQVHEYTSTVYYVHFNFMYEVLYLCCAVVWYQVPGTCVLELDYQVLVYSNWTTRYLVVYDIYEYIVSKVRLVAF